MAGVLSQERCKGCSSVHCACGDRGTWSEPSLLSQRLSEDSMRQQLLQTWTSARHSPRGAADEDRPLVFLCAGCRRPLGDSLSWVTSPDGSCILLRSVSSAVAVGKEPVLSRRENENGCVLETLHCAGCALSLGYIYRCTPDHLDYKRDLFCLKVEATESYVLGSSEKQIVSEDKELFNLESRVEIENSLKQMEDVLKVLQTKLQDVETKLSSSSHAETSCESPV
ncbi:protein Mis18-alpha [Molossus molossus]|uniref:Protein Mis18-alpha n=1 Tax=Molossus molossus TaxID=27622 RepID=A0A7J8I0F0_MOLMO|nr:protein Mis18-alpha [Molossus molossus]KAF6478116.1 MIS18 kinetochore protein A [Molossus molossus]